MVEVAVSVHSTLAPTEPQQGAYEQTAGCPRHGKSRSVRCDVSKGFALWSASSEGNVYRDGAIDPLW